VERPDVKAKREAFEKEMAYLDPEKLVFIDESGFRTNLNRGDGWAPRGEAPVLSVPRYGKNTTVIGAIALDGVRVATECTGSFDGLQFVTWLYHDLGPTLKPGDIVVMDGPRLHRIEGVKEALAAYGATVLYLPPYAPELNPIEMCWAFLKAIVRRWAPRRVERVIQSVQRAWKAVTIELCRAWIRHSGYAVPAI
jgi:transposase